MGATINIMIAGAIGMDLDANPSADLLGPFSTDDSNVDAVRISKTVYLPDLDVGMFLEQNLITVEAWSRLQGGIVDAVS